MTQKAFIHDRIVHLWGAEQVFIDLIRTYAHRSTENGNHEPVRSTTPLVTNQSMRIFTLFSNRKYLTVDNQQIPITVALPSRINQLFVRWSRPEFSKLCKIRTKLLDYRNLIVFYPLLARLLARKIRRYQPELQVISSFAAVKNVVPHGKLSNDFPTTVLYLHSPMQYIHENYQEYVRKLSWRQLLIFKPLAKILRKRDLKPRRYDYVFTNSHFTAQCAKSYYALEATTRYPLIEKEFLLTPPTTQPHSYYIYVGRLVKFIRETDLIIQLFNHLQLPLLVMGSGPDENYLKSIAWETITFIGQSTSVQEKVKIIKNARGLVNLTKESCGMATIEALAVGVPVFGFNAGGTPEFVDEKSGLLTNSKEMSTLVDMFKKFDTTAFNRLEIKQRILEKITSST